MRDDHMEVLSGATRSSTSVDSTMTRKTMDSRSESHGIAKAGMIGVVGELDYFSAHIHLRDPCKSKDKTETSMDSSIPCSHGGRSLVMKGAEEMENAEANSKYQDKVEGQRPKNLIRSVSMGFSSR
ncbi:hypothetical protein BHE74_00004650 [Ensete ventricosum]|nr:hypothetical protein GW17_00058105 [Ensete ventricosum]RWW86571.1 hypothetical protein BHE74_00004650 [Ensete ventricosum]